MNKALYKNLQNIDINKTLHFGVNITDEDKQTHCVKMSFKGGIRYKIEQSSLAFRAELISI